MIWKENREKCSGSTIIIICNLGQVTTLSTLGLSSPFCQMRELDMKVSKVSFSSQVFKYFWGRYGPRLGRQRERCIQIKALQGFRERSRKDERQGFEEKGARRELRLRGYKVGMERVCLTGWAGLSVAAGSSSSSIRHPASGPLEDGPLRTGVAMSSGSKAPGVLGRGKGSSSSPSSSRRLPELSLQPPRSGEPSLGPGPCIPASSSAS